MISVKASVPIVLHPTADAASAVDTRNSRRETADFLRRFMETREAPSAPVVQENCTQTDLTGCKKSDKLSDMKSVNAREFQKEFGKIAGSLKNGEAVAVKKHGKIIGQFQKSVS